MPHPGRLRGRKLVAFLVYPHGEAPDRSVMLKAVLGSLPATVAIQSPTARESALDVFTLFDESDAPRFVTYVYRKTVSSSP